MIRVKTGLILVPLSLCSMKCLNNNGSSNNNPNGVLNILPTGYIGRVVIIYSQKDGKEQKITGGKRVYEIPDCGILKTQFSRPTGSISIPEEKYFTYVYSNGDTISCLSNSDPIDSNRINEVFSFAHSIGGIGFDDNEDYEISEYIIDTLKNIKKYKVFQIEKSDLEKCQ